jgi:hypothetical protein
MTATSQQRDRRARVKLRPAPGFQSIPRAMVLFESSRRTLIALVQIGLLQGEQSSGTIYSAKIPEGQTLAKLSGEFFDNPGHCTTPEDFERYQILARHLLRKPRRIPPSVINDAFAYFERNGIRPTQQAFTNLLGGPVLVTRRLFHEEAATRGLIGQKLTTRRFGHKRGTDEEPAVLQRVDPIIRSMPGTALDPSTLGIAKRPPPKFFSRLNLLTNTDILETMTVITYWHFQQDGEERDLANAFTAIGRLCSVGQGRNMRDPEQLREILFEALGPEWETGHDVGFARVEMARCYFWIYDRYNALLGDLESSGRAVEFERFRPVLPIGHAALRKAANAARHRLKAIYGQNRDVAVQKILNNPEAFQLVGRLRTEEHEHILCEVDEAIKALIAAKNPLDEPVPLAISYETRLINDCFERCRQTLHLELWTWEMLLSQIKTKSRHDDRTVGLYTLAPAAKSGRDAFAIRYVGVTPEIPGGGVQVPIVAEVALGSLLNTTTGLDAAEIRVQHEARIRLGFTSPINGRLPGIPYFYKPQARIAHRARKILGITLLPLREFTLGLKIAETASRVMMDSSGRYHETSQLALDPGKIREKFDESLGQTIWAFDAYPKGESTTKEYNFLDSTMSRVIHLCELLSDYWHGGGAIPKTPGNRYHKRRRLPPAQHVFHTPTTILNHQNLGLLLRLLYLGWHAVRPHDFRHLFNSLARRNGLAVEERMRIMSHISPPVNEGYGKDTRLQRTAGNAQHAAFLLDRELKLIQKLGAADTPGAAQIVYELRRENALLEFHAKEQDLDAIEQAKSHIRELSLRLAEAGGSPQGQRRQS